MNKYTQLLVPVLMLAFLAISIYTKDMQGGVVSDIAGFGLIATFFVYLGMRSRGKKK